MNNKFKLLFGLSILLILAGCMSPPTANMEKNTNKIQNLTQGEDYETYESNIWSETPEKVEKSENHFIDLGTRTLDGATHIYLKSKAPSSNNKIEISKMYIDSENNNKTLYINASVEKTGDVGATVITTVDKHIQINNYSHTDLDKLNVTLTDGFGTTKTLERDYCACVLEKDPRPN